MQITDLLGAILSRTWSWVTVATVVIMLIGVLVALGVWGIERRRRRRPDEDSAATPLRGRAA